MLSVVLNADHVFLAHSVFIIFQILECLHRHSKGMGPSRNQEINLFPMHHTLMTRRYFFCNIINDFEHEAKFCGVDFVTNMLKDSDILMF